MNQPGMRENNTEPLSAPANHGGVASPELSWLERLPLPGFLRFSASSMRTKLWVILSSVVFVSTAIITGVVLRNQESALMNRMDQVCEALIGNLSDSVKGDLLLGQNEKVVENVWRYMNGAIEGLEKVAVFNAQGKLVAGSDVTGRAFTMRLPREFLSLQEISPQATPNSFDYYGPIVTEQEGKPIVLGVAYLSFSRDRILEPVHRARNSALKTVVVVLLVAFVVINWLSNRTTKRFRLLAERARQVGSGNFEAQFEVGSQDELGKLAIELNKMLRHLREKSHMQKFVSKLTVEMIQDTASDSVHKSLASKRNLTVLFSDVRNFSSVAERLEPSETVKLINVYFDLQTRIIESHGGVVDKFMGDQIMAVFRGKEMADGALRAAAQIQRQVRLLNQERLAAGKTILEVGIGINSGPAVVGNMGSSDRMDYTVIGDVVNVAARLCAAAKAGQIITSYNVAKTVNGSYPTSRLKSLSVKGRLQAIDVCEVDYDRDILT